MSKLSYDCYFLYFNNSRNVPSNLQTYEIHDNIKFIKIPFDNESLYKIIKKISPNIVSHQGSKRLDIMRMCNILDIYFITGFCFWNDIIEYERGITFNHKIMEKKLLKTSGFTQIIEDSDYTYVCGEFVNDIIKNVYNMELPVIHTISNINEYTKYNPNDRKYVTIINISKIGDESIILNILEKCTDVPFKIIDSQGDNTILNNKIRNIINKGTHLKNKSLLNIGHFDINEIYNDTKILLVLSFVDETFCRVAYEGMYMGIPILTTNCGNLKYLMEGYGDFLDDHSSNWIKKINSIYNNNKVLLEMSKRPKNLYENTQKIFTNTIQNILSNPKIYKSRNYNRNISFYSPWSDQGLGIQTREYYKALKYLGYNVHIYAYKPYFAIQTDKSEWNFPNIHYENHLRNEITFDKFEKYIYKNKIKTFIIIEISGDYIYDIARWCKLLNVQIMCIPNIEIIKYSELKYYSLFDTIIVNNMSTYEILKKILNSNNSPNNSINKSPNSSNLFNIKYLGFNMGICEIENYEKLFTTINNQDNISKKNNNKEISFFCCGGYNSFTRKNIDKIINSFILLENTKFNNDLYPVLHVYIQENEVPEKCNLLKNNKNIFYHIGNKTYKEVLNLYTKHDVFIHFGDHEGLGLGFYESMYFNVPVLTINCVPNNEIIKNTINGWTIKCTYTDLTDNNEGISRKAVINENDIYKKILEICKVNIDEYKNNIKNFKINYLNPNDYLKRWNNILE